MEAPGGVEPPTCGLGNRRSIHLSYGAGDCSIIARNRSHFARLLTLFCARWLAALTSLLRNSCHPLKRTRILCGRSFPACTRSANECRCFAAKTRFLPAVRDRNERSKQPLPCGEFFVALTPRLADYGNCRPIRRSKLSDDKFLVADYLVNGRYPNACSEKIYKKRAPSISDFGRVDRVTFGHGRRAFCARAGPNGN